MTIRTRDTDGISMMTFSMMGLGSIFFVVNGLMWRNYPLAITNIITAVCAVIIFGSGSEPESGFLTCFYNKCDYSHERPHL